MRIQTQHLIAKIRETQCSTLDLERISVPPVATTSVWRTTGRGARGRDMAVCRRPQPRFACSATARRGLRPRHRAPRPCPPQPSVVGSPPAPRLRLTRRSCAR
uniref:Uncharacterized protein n=1 Tax=Arundo donax TaxID=35708 RepID=A0A0A8XZN6_ARUDO